MAINKKLIHFKTKAAFEAQLTGSNILDTSIVFIQDANLIWTHGTYYGKSEIYIGTEEPTNGEVVWINLDNNEMKYWNGLEWVTVSGKAILEETLIINLASNQTNPDSNLNGAIVNVRYEDTDHRQAWGGEALSFYIPDGTEYTIEYSDITDEDGNKIYATPTMETYTAVGNETRTLSKYYNQTRITITRSSNLSDLGSTTARLSCNSWGASSKTLTFYRSQKSVTVGVPWGAEYTVTFDDVKTGSALQYNTPSAISKTANETTQTVTGEYTGCKLNVSRASNQGEQLSGDASATVTYSSYSQTVNFTTNITGGFIIIPYNVSYTIKFNGTIPNYRTPADITGIANSDFLNQIGYYDTEKVTVNVSGLTSGFTITVNGQSQTTTSKTYYIAFDTAYTISASSVKGYIATVSESSITANSKTRTVTVTYATITNGVYICDNTGNLTTIESWNTANNSSAIGVAVISDNCNFVIEKIASYSYKTWGGYGTNISGIITTTSESTAKTDYAGESNTTKIINQLGSGNAPAADYCRGRSCTVNGVTLQGYLGALGEWQTAYNNKSAIDSALSTIGGTAMNTNDYHWTSTQYSSNGAWLLLWSLGNVTYSDKFGSAYFGHCARAFYPIP